MLLNEDFLLTNKMSKRLFHKYAERMPIIDYHCHLNAKEIYENKNYKNLSQIWLNDGFYGDHYKWRLMRANGVPENLITGDGDDFEKLLAWAGTIEKAIGNPLYEWSHLELKRYFGIDTVFNRKNALKIWEKANALLVTDDFKPRKLIKRLKVKVVCTTNDPIDDLKYHKLLHEEEKKNGFKVVPSFRPDKIFDINGGGYNEYVKKLAQISGVPINNFHDILKALERRVDFFDKIGGRLSDHGLDNFYYSKVSENELDKIFLKAYQNQGELTLNDINAYKTGLIEGLMRIYYKKDWVMQYHINVIRDANTVMFKKIGSNTGFDFIGDEPHICSEVMKLLVDMEKEHSIPKTIFYSLNKNDWMVLASGMGSFQENGVQKMQLGCAWWFNDNYSGITEQLTVMAEQSLLANFVGMLTDSRSLLSYPRHEYFRRILCNLIGKWVQRGQLPEDEAYLGKIVEDISYNNAYNYFGFFR